MLYSPLPSLMQYKLKLPKQGSINHLQEEMARLSGLDKSKVCVCGCVWFVIDCRVLYWQTLVLAITEEGLEWAMAHSVWTVSLHHVCMCVCECEC